MKALLILKVQQPAKLLRLTHFRAYCEKKNQITDDDINCMRVNEANFADER